MRRGAYRLFVFFLALALAAAAAAAYAVRHSSSLLLTQIEKQLGVKASAAEVKLVFPATVVIRDLRAGDRLSVERLVITPSILGFFLKRSVVFDEILATRPVVRVLRRADASFDLGLPPKTEPEAKPKAKPEAKPEDRPKATTPRKKTPPVFIGHLKVADGRITFIDETTNPPARIDLVDIQLESRRVRALEPQRMKIDAAAQVGDGPGRLLGSAEYGIATRRGSGRLDITGVPLALLEPYYIHYSKRPVRSGSAGWESVFRVDGNDVTVDASVSLSGVAFEEPVPADAGEGTTSWRQVGEAMLAYFFLPEGDSVISLSVATHLDKPRFENVRVKGGSLGAAATQGVFIPPAAADDLKKIGKSFTAVGKELKKMFGP
ncbi:MAG: DUF748 domain-containing protein [Deltaproteobacteria bacterium]